MARGSLRHLGRYRHKHGRCFPLIHIISLCCISSRSRNHSKRSLASAEARRQCCMSHMHFKGKTPFLTPRSLANYSSDRNENWHDSLRPGVQQICGVSSCHLQGFRPHAHVKYNVVVLFFILFYFFFNDFLSFMHSSNRQTDFHG